MINGSFWYIKYNILIIYRNLKRLDYNYEYFFVYFQVKFFFEGDKYGLKIDIIIQIFLV